MFEILKKENAGSNELAEAYVEIHNFQSKLSNNREKLNPEIIDLQQKSMVGELVK